MSQIESKRHEIKFSFMGITSTVRFEKDQDNLHICIETPFGQKKETVAIDTAINELEKVRKFLNDV